MAKNPKEEIIIFIRDEGSVSSTSSIINAGFHNKYLKELVEEGSIIKIKRGLYILPEKESSSGFFEVQKAIPGSVICLGSALSFYQLTTYEPPFIWAAIERGKKVVVPQYPPVKLYRFSKKQFKTGIKIIKHEGSEIRIYDKEKTICDTIRYRNKIGLDITKEAVKNYINQKGKNINKIMEYAKILRLETPVKNYFKVLL